MGTDSGFVILAFWCALYLLGDDNSS